MKLLLAVAVGALVMGCAGREPGPVAPVTPSSGGGDWFCQMNTGGNGWDCVQDPDRARRPDPARLPQPPREPTRAPAAQPIETSTPDPVPGVEPVESGVEAAPEVEPIDMEAPDYVRLAYLPAQPMPLTELPRDLFAVQLMAMSSKEALEEFVEQSGIRGISAARVERDGALYYVLILGIYETAEDARQAAASLPDGVVSATPWIRPLGSLQAAMARADSLTGSTRY